MANEAADFKPRVERQKTWDSRMQGKLDKWDSLFNSAPKQIEQENRWLILERAARIQKEIYGMKHGDAEAHWEDGEVTAEEKADFKKQAKKDAIKELKEDRPGLFREREKDGAEKRRVERRKRNVESLTEVHYDLYVSKLAKKRGDWEGNSDELASLYEQFDKEFYKFVDMMGGWNDKYRGLKYKTRHFFNGGDDYAYDSDSLFKKFEELVNIFATVELNNGGKIEVRDLEAEKKDAKSTKAKLELFKGELREIDTKDILTWADHLVENRLTAQDVRNGDEKALMGCPSPEYVQRILANLKAGGSVAADAKIELDALGDMLAKTVTDLSHAPRALDEYEVSSGIQEKGINTLKRLAGDISNPSNMMAMAGFAVGAAILYKMFGKDNSSDGLMTKALKYGGIAIGGALVGGAALSGLGRLRENQKTLLDEAGVSLATFDMESEHMQWIRKKYDKIAEGSDHMKGILQCMSMSSKGFLDISEWMLHTMDNDPARIDDGLPDMIEANIFKDVQINPAATRLSFMNVLRRHGQKMGIDKSKFGGDETDYLKACLASCREQYDEVGWSAGTMMYDIESGSGRRPEGKSFDLENHAIAMPVIETVQAFVDSDEARVESIDAQTIRVNGQLWTLKEDMSSDYEHAPERPLILESAEFGVTSPAASVTIYPYGPSSRDWYQSKGELARANALTLVRRSNDLAQNQIVGLFKDSAGIDKDSLEFNVDKNIWEFKERKFSTDTPAFAQHLGINSEPLPAEFKQDEKTKQWGLKVPHKETVLTLNADGSKLDADVGQYFMKNFVLEQAKGLSAGLMGPLGNIELDDDETYFTVLGGNRGIAVKIHFGNGGKADLVFKDRELSSWKIEKKYLDDPALKSARRLLSSQRAQEFRKGMEDHDAYTQYLAAYEGSGGDGARAGLSFIGELYQQGLDALGQDNKDLLYMRDSLHVDTGNAVLDLLQVRYALEMEDRLRNLQGNESKGTKLDDFYRDQDASLNAEMTTIMRRALEIQGELEDTMKKDGAFATGRTRAALASSYPAKMMEIPAGGNIQCVWLLRETFALVDDPSKGFDMQGLDGAQQMTKQKAALAKAIFATYNVAAMSNLSEPQQWVRAKQIKQELVDAIRQDLRPGSASNLSFAGITIDKVFDVDTVVKRVKSRVGPVEEFKDSRYSEALARYGATVPTNAPTAADVAGRPVIKMTELIDTDQMLHGPTDTLDAKTVDWNNKAEVDKYIQHNLDYRFTQLKKLSGLVLPHLEGQEALLDSMIRLKKAQFRELYGSQIKDGKTPQVASENVFIQLDKDLAYVSASGNAYMSSLKLAEHMLGGFGNADYTDALVYAFEHIVRRNTGPGRKLGGELPWVGTDLSIELTEQRIDASSIENELGTFLRMFDVKDGTASTEKADMMMYTQYYFACLEQKKAPKTYVEFSKVEPDKRIAEIDGFDQRTSRLIEFEGKVEGMKSSIGDWGGPFEAYAQGRFGEIPTDEDFETNYQKLMQMVEEEHRIFELISAQNLTPDSEFDEQSWNPTTKGIFPSGWQLIGEIMVGFDFNPIDNVKIGHLVFASIAKQRDKVFTSKKAYRAAIKADLQILVQADGEDENGHKLFNAF